MQEVPESSDETRDGAVPEEQISLEEQVLPVESEIAEQHADEGQAPDDLPPLEQTPADDFAEETEPADEAAPDAEPVVGEPPADQLPAQDLEATHEAGTETPEPEAEADAEADAEPEAEATVAETTEVLATAVSQTDAPDVSLAAAPTPGGVPWWPFIVLAVLWLAVSGVAAYLLTRTADVPAYQQEWYPAIVLAGVVLTLLGPVVAIVTWATSRKDADGNERGGLFVSSILRAAAITLLGVLAWWGTLVVVDSLRLGLIRF